MLCPAFVFVSMDNQSDKCEPKKVGKVLQSFN